MSEFQTLVLTPWLSAHEILPWQKAMAQLAKGKLIVLEAYPGEIVRSAYLEFPFRRSHVSSVHRRDTRMG